MRPPAAKQKIEDIEGIGKLRACGIGDTAALLAKARTPRQPKVLAEKSDLAEKR